MTTDLKTLWDEAAKGYVKLSWELSGLQKEDAEAAASKCNSYASMENPPELSEVDKDAVKFYRRV
jgi:hypothetical protein